MPFCDLLEFVGSVGRFQILHVTLLTIPVLLMASHNLLQNFVASVPSHYCTPPANLSHYQLSPEELLQLTMPLDKKGTWQRCRRYAAPQWHLLDRNGTNSSAMQADAELQGCNDGWTYNMTDMTSTIISEWNLVCDQRSLKQLGQTVYMGGVLVGAMIFGPLSDRYGRRVLLMISYALMALCGTCVALCTSFVWYCGFRFGCGMALSGQMINATSLILEWIPTRIRTPTLASMGYCYTLGQLLLVLVAYYVRDWRWMTLAVSLPFIGFFLYSFWFHESSRWLALSSRKEEAIRNLQSVARFNGRHEEATKIDLKMLEDAMRRELSCSRGNYTFLDLFRTPVMRRITVLFSTVWLSTSFAYYGLAMDLQKFGVDIYLIQVIFGAVDIPAKILITFSLEYIGRRPSQALSLIVAGLTVLLMLVVPTDQQIVRTGLAVLGKGCLAASFSCCFMYCGELFPTVLRQNGIGWMSSMARVGAMVAPMVQLTGDWLPWLPGVVYGMAPILSGIAAAFLPETNGSPIPDTIQDVENRGTGRRATAPQREEIMLQNNQGNLQGQHV